MPVEIINEKVGLNNLIRAMNENRTKPDYTTGDEINRTQCVITWSLTTHKKARHSTMYIQYCPDVYYTGPTSNQHWLNDSSRWRSSLYMVLIRAPTAITFRKTAYCLLLHGSVLAVINYFYLQSQKSLHDRLRAAWTSLWVSTGHSHRANTGQWNNVSLMVAHRLQHWASIGLPVD